MLQIPAGVLADTVSVFRSCGRGRKECVAYWLGPAEEPARVDSVVHPRHHSTPVCYELEDDWLTKFWLELARSSRSARVQIHTHGGRASHSTTDDAWPLVHSPGFFSLVLPWFAMDELNLGETYLVEIGADGRWQRRQPAEALRIAA